MRRHAKASSAGSTTRGARRGSGPLLAAAAAVALTLVLGVALAGAVAPVVSVEDATGVQYTTANVKGHVNPEGQSTSWRFQYATAADFSNAQSEPSGTTETAEDVSGTLSGLQPNTTYHLRLVAENADGPSEEVATSTFKTKAVAKPTVTIEEVTTFTSTTAHFVGHVNPNAPEAAPASAEVEAAFKTHWEFQCTPNCPQLGGGNVAADNTAHTVEVNAENLEPNTPYTVKLVTFNLGGTSEALTTASPSFTTLAVAPVVDWPHFGRGTDTTAHVGAYVNPRNSALSLCKVEYGTSASYGQSVPCTGPLASGGQRVEVGADLSLLSPETEYHFRMVTENVAGTGMSSDERFTTYATPGPESCPNEDFRTEQHAGFLPDCRAYEEVSPPDKHGAPVNADPTHVRTDIAGKAVAYSSSIAFGDAVASEIKVEYMALRGPSGWTTHSISPRQQALAIFETPSAYFSSGYQGEFSADLSKGMILVKSPLTDDENVAAVGNMYLRDDLLDPGAGHYQLLSQASTQQPQPTSPFEALLPSEAGASANFSHVLFESQRNLTADTVAEALDTSEPKLYLWVDGSLELVGKIPPPGETTCGASGPTCVVAPASQAGHGAYHSQRGERAISADGSRVSFVVPASGEACNGERVCGEIYLRDDQGTSASGDDETVQVGTSERTDCADSDPCDGDPEPDPVGTRPLTYWSASSDGSQVFFTSKEQLTDDDHDGSSDLYRWELSDPPGQRLTLLSVDSEPSDDDDVKGVIGTSEDGSYVYFAAQGQLVAGGGTGGFVLGLVRIFVWHEGAIHEVGGVNEGPELERIFGTQWQGVGGPKLAQVTPDGRHLVFITAGTDELTGYDHGTCPGQLGSQVCLEVYAYDATANGGEGQLTCASCNPSGLAASGSGQFVPTTAHGISPETSHLTHPISADGHYIFFTSEEALLPQDINGTKDAYSYDTATGQVQLISSGSSDGPSTFLDATPDGHDVYFSTSQRLVSGDTDNAQDLYDARIGGGLVQPLPPPVPCAADSCQGAQASAPGATSPQSNRATGLGNVNQRHRKKHHKKKRQQKKRHASKTHAKRTSTRANG